MGTRRPIAMLAAALASGLAGCGDDDGDAAGSGDVTVTVYGEAFIEEGIPAEAMGDGWAVTFDRFIVTVDAVRVGGVAMPTPDPIDLARPTNGAGHPVASATLPAGAYTDASFMITRVELAGSATRQGETKTFDWVLDQATHYSGCETTTKVVKGGRATFQITVHADHLFYDSLVSEDPQVLFQAFADADTDSDGAITQAELAATGIGGYDPGSEGGVEDLWAWVAALGHTLGHVDGEGHCAADAHGG